MDYIGTLLGAGAATAFIMSVLDYFAPNPMTKALVALTTGIGSVFLLYGVALQAIPLSLGSTFLGVLLLSLITRETEKPDRSRGSRIPRL